jgi:hypothetical protein
MQDRDLSQETLEEAKLVEEGFGAAACCRFRRLLPRTPTPPG